MAAAALTFAYIGRFWLGLFAGARRTAPRAIPVLLVAPVVVLALVALLAWALGGLVLARPRPRDGVVAVIARAGDRLGPRRAYGAALLALNQISDRIHDAEVRDLRTSLAAIMVPGALMFAVAFVATPTSGAFDVGAVALADLPIVALLGLTVAAGLRAARDPGRLRPVLALSVLGFALAAVYAVLGAPDVALVAVVVETVLTLVFVGVFAQLPAEPAREPTAQSREQRRNAVAGIVAGVAAFATIWAALSRPSVDPGVAAEHIRRASEAHGGDVVTVILADFRGFDTLVEITVLAVAIVGVASLLRRGRAW